MCVNDHIAFRTWEIGMVAISALEPLLLHSGYLCTGRYEFPQKNLLARSYSHCGGSHPRVFLPEFSTAVLEEPSVDLTRRCVRDLDAAASPQDLLLGCATWRPIHYADNLALKAHSEYAAWVSAFGIRANHFTVAAHSLNTCASLESLCDLLESHGLVMNASGGRIKGCQQQGSAQASTMAKEIAWPFAANTAWPIPSWYVEFAYRWPDRKGNLFDGFIAGSATKIFESTHSLRG